MNWGASACTGLQAYTVETLSSCCCAWHTGRPKWVHFSRRKCRAYEGANEWSYLAWRRVGVECVLRTVSVWTTALPY